MRFLALGLSPLLAAGTAAAQPTNIYVNELEEHRVVISAPYGYDGTKKGQTELEEYAAFLCSLYHRRSVGALTITDPGDAGCRHAISSLSSGRKMSEDQRIACPQDHLFACALR